MRFSNVQHQDRALSIIRRALGSGRTHHAYLFEGPEGVGKELAARALATRLLCADDALTPDADACGKCSACCLMASDNHPDFHLIHRGLHKLHPEPRIRKSKGLFLVVDLIRHFLIEPAALKPAQGRRRVFLIRDAERMNEEAQNALLKTLEEPPGSACLILVTASAARLLATIRSRCQRIPFDFLPPDFVTQELITRLDLKPADAQALAALADGRLGVALRWHSIGLLDTVSEVVGACEGLVQRNPELFGRRLVEIATGLARAAREIDKDEQIADELAEVDEERDEDGDELAEENDDGASKRTSRAMQTAELRDALKLVFLLVAAVYRDALVVQTGAAELRRLPQPQAYVDELAAQTTPDRLETGLLAVNEAERNLDRNVAPQLTCERLAVAMLGELPTM